MLKFKNPWTPGLLMIAALLVVGLGARLLYPPHPAKTVRASCTSTAGCASGDRCIAPGVCSKPCQSDGDCPAGRHCSERPLMNPDADHAAADATVTTCLATGPL